MNRFFEEDLLRQCKDIQQKLRAVPDTIQTAALEQLIQIIIDLAEKLQPSRCDITGNLRLPKEFWEVKHGLLFCMEDLAALSESADPLPLLFREDLEKLQTFLQGCLEALLAEKVQFDDQQASAPAPWFNDEPAVRRFEDACREIEVPEDQPKPPAPDVFISYSHRDEDPERLRRMEEERRLFLEQTMREMEEVRRGSANMAPPPSAADWYRQAADIGRGITMCPVCHHVLTVSNRFCPGCGSPVETGMFGGAGLAAAGAAKQAKTAPKMERKGLFRSLFAPKKDRIKPSKEDEVQFRAAALTTIRPGEFFPVKMMMFLEGDYDRADREQAELGDQVSAVTGSVFRARPDQVFRITLRSPDLPELNESETLVWNGRFASLYIYLGLPADFDKKQLRLQSRVYSGDAVVTDLKMLLRVGDPNPQEVSCEKCALRSAFISYASADRAQVVSRIQGIQLAAPDLDLFFDVENLQRGEHWEPRLYKEIEKRDLFYLFWSKNAASSPWVAKELQYALEHKHPDSIEPVPLDPPDECPPPDALKDRHFNDWTLRYRKP